MFYTQIVVMDQEKMFDPTGIIGNGNRDQDELRPSMGDIGNGNR